MTVAFDESIPALLKELDDKLFHAIRLARLLDEMATGHPGGIDPIVDGMGEIGIRLTSDIDDARALVEVIEHGQKLVSASHGAGERA